jgi:hypothetical protein
MVKVQGDWAGNGLRFATEKEALDNAHALAMRWFAVEDYRAEASPDPVNYTWTDGRLDSVLPAGVVAVPLEDPATLHNAIKDAVGE